MTFPGYLSVNEIDELVSVAVDADLVTANRTLLLQSIFKPFALGLPRDNDILTQFNLDVVRLNSTERLANGQVPLIEFLHNCATYLRLRGRSEADKFEEAANLIQNRVQGVVNLPDPAALREVKNNEAIIGMDDMLDFRFLATGTQVGLSVARISVPRFDSGVAAKTGAGAPWIMLGTAWMLAPQFMITNHHVINARLANEASAAPADFERQAQESFVEFDFDSADSVTVQIKIASVIASSKDLDYAIVRLQSDPGRRSLRLKPSRIEFTPATYLPVNIIQHPRGLPKRIAVRNNLLTGAEVDTIRYFTDTDSGSSGSPVCDDSWRVIGLHRGAQFVDGVTYQGKASAFVNLGSQIQAVLDHLKRLEPQVYAEVMTGQS
jgi:endonuclease G